MMDLTPLTAIGAADGRYRAKVAGLAPILSEFGLMRFRVQVECRWFAKLAQLDEIGELPPLGEAQSRALRAIHDDFSLKDAESVKALEAGTNHDVKAVEYFVKQRVAAIPGLAAHTEFVHFACTSEDINNLAHGLMLRAARALLLRDMGRIVAAINALASEAGDLPLLARTHGQPASPTTLAKELRVFSTRLGRARATIAAVVLRGKLNGAVGNFNAHAAAYPTIDWPAVAAAFVVGLGLDPNPLTTQIEPHDYMAELFHGLIRFNSVLLDFDRDMWGYIAIDYFGQRVVADETGSSTMPHKVNPIDFENSEGNLGIANALLAHMAEKLPVSRWQRDLSDSTVLRNIGTAFAHCGIAYQAAVRGISRLSINRGAIEADLVDNWELLAEAVQTVMRKHGLREPYERLKSATRGQRLNAESYLQLLDQLDLPNPARQTLLGLSPTTYIGLAEQLSANRD